MKQDPLGTLMAFKTSSQTAKFYSLRQLEAQGLGALSGCQFQFVFCSNQYLATATANVSPKRTYSVSRAGSLMRNELKNNRT